MWGPPEDVEGDCNAHIYIADDYGDNEATCRCNLPKEHMGLHVHSFKRDGEEVQVIWKTDERNYADQEREEDYRRKEA